MAAAIALAVVLVIAVAGLSLAMQTQHPLQAPGRPRTMRPPGARPADAPRRPRRSTPKPAPSPTPPPTPEPAVPVSSPGPELLRSGVASAARVVSVVDERVVGPVTRSRLTLMVEPEGAEPFEVSLRHAFPSPAARGRVKVGGTIPVRYDRDKPKKVVIDPGPEDSESPDAGPGEPGPRTSGPPEG